MLYRERGSHGILGVDKGKGFYQFTVKVITEAIGSSLLVLLPFEFVHSIRKPAFLINVQFQFISVEMIVINGIYN